MPRPWSEYNAREWRRLRPLVDRYSHGRYQLRMAYHVRRHLPDRRQMRGLASRITGRKLLVTIAFNDADLIAWQVKLVRQYVADCIHLIADNSTSPQAVSAIAAIAAAHDLPCLRPPQSPWLKLEHGGRGHGLAMTWLWRNVIRKAKPAAFGFIDHDIFPLCRTDPFRLIAEYPVGGRVRIHMDRWYLWAGFCFFRFQEIQRYNLNFSTDWTAGLDTGGCNWFRLYRRLDRTKVGDPGISYESIEPDISLSLARFERIGDWLHESNFSTRADLDPNIRQQIRARKRQLLLQRLAVL
jgi:hypothetical protein